MVEGVGISTHAVWLECLLLITLHYTEEIAHAAQKDEKWEYEKKEERLEDRMRRFRVCVHNRHIHIYIHIHTRRCIYGLYRRD